MLAVLQQPVRYGHPAEVAQVLGRPDVRDRLVAVGAQGHQEVHLVSDERGGVALSGEPTIAASAGCMATHAPDACRTRSARPRWS